MEDTQKRDMEEVKEQEDKNDLAKNGKEDDTKN